MRFEEGLNDLLIGFLLDVFNRRSVVRISRNQNSNVVVIVESERQKVGEARIGFKRTLPRSSVIGSKQGSVRDGLSGSGWKEIGVSSCNGSSYGHFWAP